MSREMGPTALAPTPAGSEKPKAVVSWSSGKDSALALHETVSQGDCEVVGLLTTLTEPFDRVSMHGVRAEVLEAQAGSVGLPLIPVSIPFPCPNAVYEARMGAVVNRLRVHGVSRMVFGDLFLEEVRAYREQKLDGSGIEPVFPLWGRPTRPLAERMIRIGLRATLVTVDPKKLAPDFAGRAFDDRLLSDLPPTVDPCGERGEFHTCVTAGPMFRWPIPVEAGPVVERDGFVFADLRLKPKATRDGPGPTPPRSP